MDIIGGRIAPKGMSVRHGDLVRNFYLETQVVMAVVLIRPPSQTRGRYNINCAELGGKRRFSFNETARRYFRLRDPCDCHTTHD